jgi:carboxypeptidase Taq
MEFLSGAIRIEDLPVAFSDRCERYHGVRPNNDARGVLQDVHWSAGMFGYFGTYTLGNLASAQLFDQFAEEFPDWETEVAGGNFQSLHRWLQHNVYPHGHTMSIDDLLRRVTGKPLDPQHWCRYIERKFAHQMKMAGSVV